MLRTDASVRAGLIRERIAEIRRIDRRVARLEGDITAKLRQLGSRLPTLRGIGTLRAAKVLETWASSSCVRSPSRVC